MLVAFIFHSSHPYVTAGRAIFDHMLADVRGLRPRPRTPTWTRMKKIPFPLLHISFILMLLLRKASIVMPRCTIDMHMHQYLWFIMYIILKAESFKWRSCTFKGRLLGIILDMIAANDRRRHDVTCSPFGWAHTQNVPGLTNAVYSTDVTPKGAAIYRSIADRCCKEFPVSLTIVNSILPL